MFALLAALAVAAPTDVHHQGRLLDVSGVPIDGSQSVTFTLFDAATGGANLWDQTLTVDVEYGYFSVELALDPTDFNGAARWLETSVGARVLAPRQAIASVPYALALSTPSSLPAGTTLNGATIATGAHYTDANVVDGPLSLHAATTLDGAVVAVHTPQGALCDGNFCTYSFSTTSPPYAHPSCASPGKDIKLGTLAGTNSGDSTTIQITTNGSHRGIGASYWCHKEVVITAGDALFSNTVLAAGGSASRCGAAGVGGAGYSVSYPNFSGGDVHWHIPLNCGATQSIDFTIRYDPTYFTLTAQP